MITKEKQDEILDTIRNILSDSASAGLTPPQLELQRHALFVGVMICLELKETPESWIYQLSQRNTAVLL